MKNKMKTLATLILIFSTFISSAQTSLDRKVFEKINKYRDSLCLPKLEWDSCAYKASEYQSTYLKSANGLLSHNNPNKGYESSSDRYKMFGGVSRKTKMIVKGEDVYYESNGEIINFVNKNLPNTTSYSDIEDILAILIVNAWKSSKDHNKIMTKDIMKYAGCCSQVVKMKTDSNRWTHYQIYSTMFLSN